MTPLRRLPLALIFLCGLSGNLSASTYAPPSSDPQQLHSFGGYVYFSADDGLHGRELWRTTSTGDVELIADITPGSEGSNISHFFDFGEILLFRVATASGATELWRTDGTAPGTKRIARFERTSGEGFDGFIGVSPDGRAYFRVLADATQFWVTDGTPAGTRACTMSLADGTRIAIDYAGVVLDGHLYFGGIHPADGPGMFRYDTGSETTETLARLNASEVDFLVLGEGQVLFRGGTPDYGLELMVTDGTPGGTRLVADIAPGAASSFPNGFALVESTFPYTAAHPERLTLVPNANAPNHAIFAADDGTHGIEPWLTDGTREGTRLLADVYPGKENSGAYNFKVYGDRITFVARSEGIGRELWFTYRPFETANPMGDLNPGPPGSDPYAICRLFENEAVFSALNPAFGEELFYSNATTREARLLMDIYPGAESSFPYWSVFLDGRVIFAATDPVHGRELWYVDTNRQVGLLADIYTDGSVNPSSSPSQLTPAGELLYFVCNDIAHGEELWVSDGTNSGTRLLRDIFPGPASSNPQEITPIEGNNIYFTAEDGDGVIGLWRSGGAAESTLPVPLDAQMPKHLIAMGTTLFFTATRAGEGRELWRMPPEGTPELVRDIAPGPASSNPRNLAVLNGAIYFLADDGVHGEELWRSDGTESGTVMVRDISGVPYEEIQTGALAPVEDQLFFVAGSSSHGMELWHYAEGFSRPLPLKDIARWDSATVGPPP